MAAMPIDTGEMLVSASSSYMSSAENAKEVCISGSCERHSKVPRQENLINLGEVSAAKAYRAPFGQVRSRFETVTENCNSNPLMYGKDSFKTVRDRYNRLQG